MRWHETLVSFGVRVTCLVICCSCAWVWWCQGCEDAKPTETSEGCWGWVGCRAECLTCNVVCGAGPPSVGHFQESPPSLPLHALWDYMPVFFHPSQHEGSLMVWGANSEESRFGLLYYKVGIATGEWTNVETDICQGLYCWSSCEVQQVQIWGGINACYCAD